MPWHGFDIIIEFTIHNSHTQEKARSNWKIYKLNGWLRLTFSINFWKAILSIDSGFRNDSQQIKPRISHTGKKKKKIQRNKEEEELLMAQCDENRGIICRILLLCHRATSMLMMKLMLWLHIHPSVVIKLIMLIRNFSPFCNAPPCLYLFAPLTFIFLWWLLSLQWVSFSLLKVCYFDIQLVY